MARNIYSHSIDLKKICVKNVPRKKFAKAISDIEYRGYEVEQCADGRKIVITKPGGKSVYGHPKKEDIQVFIYDPKDSSLWQISHKQIFEDISEKCKEDAVKGEKLIKYLERVYNGEEPEDFVEEIRVLSFKKGEQPEELIKAYKWIWGQEDVNYPNGQGRDMSWQAYKNLLSTL